MKLYIPDEIAKKIKSYPKDAQKKILGALMVLSAAEDVSTPYLHHRVGKIENTNFWVYRVFENVRLVGSFSEENGEFIFTVTDLYNKEGSRSQAIKNYQEKVRESISVQNQETTTSNALSILDQLNIEPSDFSDQHQNIKILLGRMDRDLVAKDYSGVLHSSASIFETLAKETVKLPTIQNQSLGAFFDRFRKDANLPDEIADYILKIYKKRNAEPLAGHGSLDPSTIDKREAIILAEITKAIIRIQKALVSSGVD